MPMLNRYPTKDVLSFRLVSLAKDRNGYRYSIAGEESSCTGWRRGSEHEVRRQIERQLKLLNQRHQLSVRPHESHGRIARS